MMTSEPKSPMIMPTDGQALRLDGVLRQSERGLVFQRIKLSAGLLSSDQARGLAALASEFGKGSIHLTTRGNLEIHGIPESAVPALRERLAALGLSGRGTAGPAVRGVACTGLGVGRDTAFLADLAGRLQRRFTGDPRYEKLPKKFKISLETDARDGRHLVQDMGLVWHPAPSGEPAWDVWIAGGLGRDPQPGFLLEAGVPDDGILGLVEAVLAVYSAHAAAGKRLKHVARDLGPDVLRQAVAEAARRGSSRPARRQAPAPAESGASPVACLEAVVFAGNLTSADFARLARFADDWAGGRLTVTTDQNLAFMVIGDAIAARAELARLGFGPDVPERQIRIRVCPGSHECRLGLAPTRELARHAVAAMGPAARAGSWAVSGCPNSCALPQLADFGLVVRGLAKEPNGQSEPRIDLYRRSGAGLGQVAAANLTQEDMLAAVRALG
jgi:sulfite reductase beta subunit-like hemoprotein